MTEELKMIKKLYGESMAHLCRKLFPTILETEGLLLNTLKKHFNESKELCADIKKQNKEREFQYFIYNVVGMKNILILSTTKSPKELFSEAGYYLYECKSEKNIQKFKKYYARGEELCTFNGNRLNLCHIFFAVKKDVKNIKRKNFLDPKRQDLYGTSVISIQFTKGKKNVLSIKNRYNDAVSNPDATFDNDLDLIIPGLTESFSKKYNFNILSNSELNDSSDLYFNLENYILASDGKYYYRITYRYNNGYIYYGPDNIIIDNQVVKKYDTSRYLVFDEFILDMQEKKIESYIDSEKEFINSLSDIKEIKIIKKDDIKEISINFIDESKKEVIIKIDKLNNMISLNNPNLIEIGNSFLVHNRLKEFTAENLMKIGSNFMKYNDSMLKLYFPNLLEIKNSFMHSNNSLITFYAPKLTEIGDNFLSWNEMLKYFHAAKLIKIGDNCLYLNKTLKEFYTPNLIEVGIGLLEHNKYFRNFMPFKFSKAIKWIITGKTAIKWGVLDNSHQRKRTLN